MTHSGPTHAEVMQAFSALEPDVSRSCGLCRHAHVGFLSLREPECRHPQMVRFALDPVAGVRRQLPWPQCEYERGSFSNAGCGPKGRLFERKA